ncbi:MAG TPA: lyase [bacterium]|nr:lyase [bacterium]
MNTTRIPWLAAAFAAAGLLVLLGAAGGGVQSAPPPLREYAVPMGSHPHDVAPARDGTVWYTAQTAGELGRLDPATGKIQHVKLGEGSAPHGVIIGPDGAVWVTDGGLDAIVHVSADGGSIKRFPLPAGRPHNDLNTAAFDKHGVLWFTGQAGIYGRVTLSTGRVEIWDAPGGPGPYGMTVTPAGGIYFASLAGSYVGRIDPKTAKVAVLEPPTPRQGARRMWADSKGRLWITEWDGGNLARYDPATAAWKEYRLPGPAPKPYAVYVDEHDQVWLSDWDANALVRFDPQTERFESFPLPSPSGGVRQLNGRPGQVWGAESTVNKLVVLAR